MERTYETWILPKQKGKEIYVTDMDVRARVRFVSKHRKVSIGKDLRFGIQRKVSIVRGLDPTRKRRGRTRSLDERKEDGRMGIGNQGEMKVRTIDGRDEKKKKTRVTKVQPKKKTRKKTRS